MDKIRKCGCFKPSGAARCRLFLRGGARGPEIQRQERPLCSKMRRKGVLDLLSLGECFTFAKIWCLPTGKWEAGLSEPGGGALGLGIL